MVQSGHRLGARGVWRPRLLGVRDRLQRIRPPGRIQHSLIDRFDSDAEWIAEVDAGCS